MARTQATLPEGTGENTLAKEVLGALDGTMLCLADRGFFGFEMWRQALATKAQLLWRIKKNAALACDKRLTDGSYLSRIYPCEKDRTHQTNAITVRVIAYRLQGVADAEPIYRLVACRRGRRNKRGVKRKMSNWPLRRSHSTPQQPVNIRQTIQIVK